MEDKKQDQKPDYLPERMQKIDDGIRVKPYTMKELCNLYGMSYRIMKSFIRPIADKLGPVAGRMFNVRQVELIFAHIGLPYTIKDR